MVNTITFSIIIFLNVLTLGASETIDRTCLLMTTVKWVDVCHGTITNEMKLKYKDQLTNIGTPFKIMISENADVGFLVTFYDSYLRNCSSLRVDSNSVAMCENKGNYTIKRSMIHCFEFYLFYADELTRICYDPADSKTRQAPPIRFTALHYAYKPPIEAGQAGLDIGMKWVFWSITAILVWIM
ncbi:uncharacterized protein LOC126756401 [Bactrocera neohumeralis]|uniref:uncharacterized protein LOC126756401 n=1 Tax=Bactrocera neohumeralis TaxID=98809 RepID=UPI0021652020|nr:uncharacterized protein LOC126756401 [Bactrocera neohumeralis]